MMHRCVHHGLKPLLQVSPDLVDRGPLKDEDVVNVFYEVDGNIALTYYVSPEFATKHHLRDGVLPWEDQELAWEHGLKTACVVCFEMKHKGWFDNNCPNSDFRWRASKP